MKLADLMEKAMTGHSNTIYDNIDNINNQYVLFKIVRGEKLVYLISDNLHSVLEKRDIYNKNGWPSWKRDKIIIQNKIVNKKDLLFDIAKYEDNKINKKMIKKPQKIKEKINKTNNESNIKKKTKKLIKKPCFKKSKHSSKEKILETKLKKLLKNKLINYNNLYNENVINVNKSKYGSYTIKKTINGKNRSFGSYVSFKSALLIKKYLKRNNWNKTPDEIRKRFSHFLFTKPKKKKIKESKRKKKHFNFKNEKYYNRVDPIVYDPSMTYIPKQK